jgi:hypothetical protein
MSSIVEPDGAAAAASHPAPEPNYLHCLQEQSQRRVVREWGYGYRSGSLPDDDILNFEDFYAGFTDRLVSIRYARLRITLGESSHRNPA